MGEVEDPIEGTNGYGGAATFPTVLAGYMD